MYVTLISPLYEMYVTDLSLYEMYVTLISPHTKCM